MWGSLNIASIRDAAAKLKDGLEAQMDEAMQQSGPVVVRAGPAGAAGDHSPGSQAGGGGRDKGGLLSSPPRVPGLQLSGGYGSGGGGGRGSDRRSADRPGWNAGKGGDSPPPSPPPRASRLGSQPPPQPETALAGGIGIGSNGNVKGGGGRAEAARQRRERLKRERAQQKQKAAGGGGGDSNGGAATDNNKEMPRVRRLPTSPNMPGSPSNVTGSIEDIGSAPSFPSGAANVSVGILPPVAPAATAGDDEHDIAGDDEEAAVRVTAGGDYDVEGEGMAAAERVESSTLLPKADGLIEVAVDGASAEAGDISLDDSNGDEDLEGEETSETAVDTGGRRGTVEPAHATQPIASGATDEGISVEGAAPLGNLSAGIDSASNAAAGSDGGDAPSEGCPAAAAAVGEERGEIVVDGAVMPKMRVGQGDGHGDDDPRLGKQREGTEGEKGSSSRGTESSSSTVPPSSIPNPEADESEGGDVVDDAGAATIAHELAEVQIEEGGDVAASTAAFEPEVAVAREGMLEALPGSSITVGDSGVSAAAPAASEGGDGLADDKKSEKDGEENDNGASDEAVVADGDSVSNSSTDNRAIAVADSPDAEEPPEGHADGGQAAEALHSAAVGAITAANAATAETETTMATPSAAAAASSAREREDALTARLLMAEELLVERERQLESANLAMAEIMQNGGRGSGGSTGAAAGSDGNSSAAAVAEEKAAGERALADLRARHGRDVARLEDLIKAEQRKGKETADAVRSWETRAEEFEEKDKMLKAYMDEGAMLAFKQSEMEKTVRKARGALRGVQEERDALAKDKLALQTSLAGLREQLRAKDEERASQTQSLAAMGAVSQASSHRLNTAEKELERMREALSAKKAALDKSWAETKELKRSLADLRSEKEALAKSVEDGGKARQATESQLQQWQHRESTLLLEQSQLQETLERVRREADRREDEAKVRQDDVRRRWKEAVARAEALQAEAHESTAPLLRQVRSLQEEMRLRQEAVRAAEASLTDRASSAEVACREAERRRRAAEAAVAAAEEKAHRAEGEVESLGFKLARLETSYDDIKAQCAVHAQRASEFEVELSSLKESARAAELQHKATETKLRLQVGDAEDRLEEALRRVESERRDAKDAASSLKEQLDNLRRGQQTSRLYGGSLDRAGRRGPPETWSRRDSGSFSIDESLSLAGSPSGTPRPSASGGSANGGGASFAEVDRLQSLARQKQGQADVLQQRLEEVQATRDALTEEVASLGRRNTELEALAKAVPLLRQQAVELMEKNSILLDLLGEKTEDFEAVQADMREMQNMYRAQYDELLSRAEGGIANGIGPA